eukprot:scaffold13627_cov99-Skeletonema_marinoi.AAC.2
MDTCMGGGLVGGANLSKDAVHGRHIRSSSGLFRLSSSLSTKDVKKRYETEPRNKQLTASYSVDSCHRV